MIAGTSTQGGASASLQVVSTQGFSGPVSVTCASNKLPGLSCQPSSVSVTPTSPGSAYFAIPMDYSQTFGTMTGTIVFTGTAGTITNSLPLPATITYRDFTLNIDQPTLSLSTGTSQPDQLIVLSNQLNQELDLACTTDNPQVTCSPATASFTDSGSYQKGLTYTIASTGSTATTSTVTITGTSSPLNHTAQVAVTVIVPDFSLVLANTSLSIASGGTTANTLTVTPGQGFSADVSLSCSVASSLGATTCSITPATVTGGNGTATVNVQAARLATNHPAPLPFWPGKGTLYSLAFAVGLLVTNFPRGRKPQGKAGRALLGVLVLALVLPAASCGGGGGAGVGGGGNGGSGLLPLTGAITVQATGGGVTHTTSFTLTINAS
jgi:hypothetical protein